MHPPNSYSVNDMAPRICARAVRGREGGGSPKGQPRPAQASPGVPYLAGGKRAEQAEPEEKTLAALRWECMHDESRTRMGRGGVGKRGVAVGLAGVGCGGWGSGCDDGGGGGRPLTRTSEGALSLSLDRSIAKVCLAPTIADCSQRTYLPYPIPVHFLWPRARGSHVCRV